MEKRGKLSRTTKIVIAVFAGIAFGLLVPKIGGELEIVGQIFLKLMQMAIPALVLGQIIQAVGGIKLKELSNIGVAAIVVFGISSLLASAWGVMFALLFKPGTGVNIAIQQSSDIQAQNISLKETILGFFSKNIFASLSEGNIIQIIIFAILFGIGLSVYREQNSKLILGKVVEEFNEVIMTIINLIMYLAPVGIFALIASTISKLGYDIIFPLLKYLLVYGVGTLTFIALWAVVISLYCKVSPFKLLSNTREMSVMALATTSSAVTLPTAINESETKIGLSEKVANLVLSLGMSLNSNGSAMHMAITVVTISQLYSIDFNLSTLLYLIVLSTFVSLANAVVPGAGLVSLAIIVPQMGLPIESIAIFAGVEWFVGMLRTILNVNSDVFSALIVGKTFNEVDYTIFNK